MDKPFCYSPHMVGLYQLHGMEGRCEAGAISQLRRGQATWNLFWLSVPAIDVLPGAGPHWYRLYQVVPGAAEAVTSDVGLDEVLYRKLIMHPIRFLSWFEREDPTIYSCYEALGEKDWADTVIKRAHESAARLAKVHSPLKEGNVTYALFGKKAA